MRLAHFSDIHLLNLDGARVVDFLNKRWTGGANLLLYRGRHYHAGTFDALVDDLNLQGVDHVACTGDLTNLGLEGEFHFARRSLGRIAVGVANVTCIPGNHDVYVPRAVGRFEAVLEPYCSSDLDWRWPGGERWPTVRVRGDLAIIGLATSTPTAWFMAHGAIGDAQRVRLEAVLSDARLAHLYRVVLLHHPPAGPHAAVPHRGLRDRRAFAEVLRRAGAELVLHGHEHLDLEGSLPGPAGPIPVRGVRSGTYSGSLTRRRASYRLFHIERISGAARPRLAGVETRTLEPDGRRFGPTSAPPPPAIAVEAAGAR